jgi:hypothetical protein
MPDLIFVTFAVYQVGDMLIDYYVLVLIIT